MSRLVVALGGNTLLRRGQPLEAEVQRANLRETARAIADLAVENELVLTHGNGARSGCSRSRQTPTRTSSPTRSRSWGREPGDDRYLIVQALRAETDSSVVALLTEVAAGRSGTLIGPLALETTG